MGEVFRAETLPIANVVRRVAIKRIAGATPAEQEQLVEEARVWVRLTHPNVVQVIDFGEEQGDWFLALELVDGLSAAQLLARTGPLPVPEALCIVERVARALSYAHSLEEDGRSISLIHRDVKPGNILIS